MLKVSEKINEIRKKNTVAKDLFPGQQEALWKQLTGSQKASEKERIKMYIKLYFFYLIITFPWPLSLLFSLYPVHVLCMVLNL